ncbi:hypothetical protein ACNKHT_16785 [Shigella flexneri]
MRFAVLRRQYTDNGDFGVITYALLTVVVRCADVIGLDGVARLTFTEKLNNPSDAT